jgi:amidophosphoribosyltransferase
MPGQALREKSVRQKLNPIKIEFQDKNVLLVDDSIVRGTTSKEIVQMAREAGAKKVYLVSAAPPVRFPNVYGIDMPSRNELLAPNKTDEEIREEIGADELIYQDLDALIENIASINPKLKKFDASCFDGKYITGDIDEYYLKNIETLRADSNMSDKPSNASIQMDLNLIKDEEEAV